MGSLTLSKSIENAEKALALCMCNKFFEAESFLEPLDESCMYHTISKATISYLQALLTYEQEYIEKAYEKVKIASHLCDRYRKRQTWSETFYNFMGRPFFDDFTELELHAELCYAECLLERAMLTFIQDENLISFIKGGLKIRSAYNMYRSCMHALEQKPKALEDSENKIDFESGVYMGMGSFNVLLSLLPARVLRLLEWVGFSGNKANGLKWLNDGYRLKGLRSPICTITLLGYQIVISPILGIGDTDIPYSQSVLNVYLEKFPKSSIFLYFSGRLKQTQGQLNEALELYEKSVSLNIDWQQMHHICYWEMMWCHSFQSNWLKAAEYAEKLSIESKWSKSSYLYMRAAFLLMQQFELMYSGNDKKRKKAQQMTSQIEVILDDVGKYKQRIAGKSIPFEKFAVRRVEKYKDAKKLILPGLEIIHIWNGFTMFTDHTETLRHFLHLCEVALEEVLRQPAASKERNDDVCLCNLLQGICLRYLGEIKKAEKVFNAVTASPLSCHSSKMDSYFPPYASCELGFMYRDVGENDRALHQLQHTLKHYSKYGLESRLHFRIHSGIESLKSLNIGPTAPTAKTVEESEADFFDVDEYAGETGYGASAVEKNKLQHGHLDCKNEMAQNYSQQSKEELLNWVKPKSTSFSLSTTQPANFEESAITNLIVDSKISSNSKQGKKTKPVEGLISREASPFHTPCDSPTLSEASSTISPTHSNLMKNGKGRLEVRVTSL
ncbi:tetratricopeptide repeat protein 39B-like isoform X1 [Hydractinia symbiolongicarpus]|uniref:tetratricopeptide repeat protein 39B-like isoform X1 n=1 Tax=Hydractinia symbiolongicarpus TaxID=13093 RepID=UPI00254C5AEF|nr:tetratricopeptide repeat protein 39B-like isoform X1 [Hydractinia symbiolongicarpus]